MSASRRTFISRMLAAGAGLAAAPLIGLPARAFAFQIPRSSAGNALRLPAAFAGGTMAARVGSQEVWPGEQTPVWTLGESYPSPTITVRRGERFAVRLRNELPEETIVHWHGQIIPEDMDGHPMDAVAPGGSYDYSFDVINRAGTYWYHPHPHGRSAPQVYMGMAGFFIVTDEAEDALGLPTGAFDIPLLVHDRRAATTHRFDYAPQTIDRLNGFLGDTILANGTPDAYLEVSADIYRIRVLNGSNARILNLGFPDGRTFQIIGTDGGLLDRPYEVEKILLGPAERVELLIDFSGDAPGTSAQFKSLRFFAPSSAEQQGFELPILRFDITRPTSASTTIPERLAAVERLDPTQAARTQIFELNTNPSAPGMEFHHINGKMFDMHRIDATAGDGEIEIWEIRNLHIMPHPIHIHGVQFQVLERTNGLPSTPMDKGWKDTILVWKEETVRVIMRFGPYRGTYLIHCHNLEHEDGGMMLNYRIGEFVSAVEEGAPFPTRIDLR